MSQSHIVPPLADPLSVESDEPGFYDAYANFARNLRTWLLAYGVGAPVIFLTNEGAGKRLLNSGQAETVAYLFLGGVALQVLAALLYKYAMWFLYAGQSSNTVKGNRWYSVSDWLSNAVWLEFLFDFATVALFSWATWRVLRATLS